ncbi:MAG: discoidin domain-containing protein [Capsulimonas sp.]|uniref:discoidin domain-containing protein n=1 Tax=Capsulimonas sp. TaxID=2494211 RepID=UPI0032646611
MNALAYKYIINDSGSHMDAPDFVLDAPLLYDGNPGDASTGYTTAGTGHGYLRAFIDLGSTVNVRGVRLSGNLFYFFILYSTDGVNWNAVGPISSGSTFACNINARYLQGGPASEITDFHAYDSANALIGAPSAPPTAAPSLTFGTLTSKVVPVIIPALGGGAASYDLQRASDVSGGAGAYVTIQASVTPSAAYPDTTAIPKQRFWYRLLAVNGSGAAAGLGAPVTVPDILAPSLSGVALLTNNVPIIRVSGA